MSWQKGVVCHIINLVIQFYVILSVQHREIHNMNIDLLINNIDHACPLNNTIHRIFEVQVEKTPDNIAVVYENQRLTYRELNEQSNQLAHFIRQYYKDQKCEFKPGTFVTLCLDKSLEMVIAIFAVLKAGGAYVPVDPDAPEYRIKYILDDTNSQLLLTQTHIISRLQILENSKVALVALDKLSYQHNNKINLLLPSQSTDFVYVMYTSGTTGKPKGVVVQHVSFLVGLRAFSALIEISQRIVAVLTLPYCFDGALPLLFVPLLTGGEIIVTNTFPNAPVDDVFDLFVRNDVNLIRLTPTLFNAVVAELLLYPRTLTIVLGGEAYDEKAIHTVAGNKNIRLYNQYGPSECVVGCSGSKLSEIVHGQLIGKPYPGKKAYVLGVDMRRVPVGEIGELYMGGTGLARGYLNLPDLTCERFIDDPFVTKQDKLCGYTRMYKTGDLVRWLPDGNLEYLGRNDFQIKIRGYRIEPGEIISVLSGHPEVQQTVVLPFLKEVNNITNHYLVAYYKSVEVIIESDLRAHLAKYLPDYMIPSVFVHVIRFPSTLNGKLDRNALPLPELGGDDREYVAPKTELEKQLCIIWQDVLGIQRVGILDDFFKLGGHSITAIQLSAKLRQQNVECSVKTIFSCRCIARVVEHLLDGLKNEITTTVQIKDSHDYSEKLSKLLLKKLQKRYDIQAIYSVSVLQREFAQYACTGQYEKGIWEIPIVFDYRHKLDRALYKQAWGLVMQIYPALRVCFNWDEELVQIICKNGELDFTEHDISGHKNQDAAEKAIFFQTAAKPFDLTQPSLIRIHLIKRSEKHFTLYAKVHHISFDGWSLTILMDRVHECYQTLMKGQISILLEDKAYFDALTYFNKNQTIAEQYWLNEIQSVTQQNDLTPLLSEPVDLFTVTQFNQVRYQSICINEKIFYELECILDKVGVTLHTLVQFACHKLLHQFIKANKTVIYTTTSGRGIPVIDVGRSVGCYIGFYPLIVNWDNVYTAYEHLKEIQEKIIENEQHSDIRSESIYEKMNDLSNIEILFQNAPYPKQDWGDLRGSFNISKRMLKPDEPIDTALTFECCINENTLNIDFKYDASYLSDSKAKAILAHLEVIFISLPNELLSKKHSLNGV